MASGCRALKNGIAFRRNRFHGVASENFRDDAFDKIVFSSDSLVHGPGLMARLPDVGKPRAIIGDRMPITAGWDSKPRHGAPVFPPRLLRIVSGAVPPSQGGWNGV